MRAAVSAASRSQSVMCVSVIVPPDRTAAAIPSSTDDLDPGEEERDFGGGILRTVRTMHRIRLDAFREFGADRPRRRLLRIRGAHRITVAQDRVLAFQRLHHHRTR